MTLSGRVNTLPRYRVAKSGRHECHFVLGLDAGSLVDEAQGPVLVDVFAQGPAAKAASKLHLKSKCIVAGRLLFGWREIPSEEEGTSALRIVVATHAVGFIPYIARGFEGYEGDDLSEDDEWEEESRTQVDAYSLATLPATQVLFSEAKA